MMDNKVLSGSLFLIFSVLIFMIGFLAASNRNKDLLLSCYKIKSGIVYNQCENVSTEKLLSASSDVSGITNVSSNKRTDFNPEEYVLKFGTGIIRDIDIDEDEVEINLEIENPFFKEDSEFDEAVLRKKELDLDLAVFDDCVVYGTAASEVITVNDLKRRDKVSVVFQDEIFAERDMEAVCKSITMIK